MGLFNPTRSSDDVSAMMPEPVIPIDLAEDDDYYYIYADVPGKSIREIKMKFKGEKLSIRLIEEEDDDNPIADKSCLIQERIHDEVERFISFEEPIDKKSVEAKLEMGLLTVTIKKMNPEEEEEEDLILIQA